MTIDDLKNQKLLLLECISGSKAYGLDTPQSDIDIRGVFILPQTHFYSLNYIPQVSDATNDVVYYELRRFMELLSKNNPNILELLNTPASHTLYKHPLMDRLVPTDFLSKKCQHTFAGYAVAQIKKAKGLNKKIVNPVDEKRKTVLDFCYVPKNQGAIPIQQFLKEKGMDQSQCGLVKIAHMHDMYGVFHSDKIKYKGIVQGDQSNDISLSSIAKGAEPITIMSFNKDGYSKYCKDYKAYWDWVAKRNESRYENTVEHGKNYDAKNMMHTFRLLEMAKEIGESGTIQVHRPDRAYLLKVRSGTFQYDELVTIAEEKITAIEKIYAQSTLPKEPNLQKINELLIAIRKDFYTNRF